MTPITAQDQYDTILYRLNALEKAVQQLQQQFGLYVPVRENELQLSPIHTTIERTEREILDLKNQLKSIGDKIGTQGKESQDRDDAQSRTLAELQIKALWFAVTSVIGVPTTILIGVLIAYFSHLIH